MKKNRQSFIVTVTLPESYTVKEMADMIRSDIGSWRGNCHPADQIWDFNSKSVTVKPIKKEEPL